MEQARDSRHEWRAVVAIALGVAIVAACLAVFSLGLRSVMEIGGSCSSGGSRVISRPCPQGTTFLVTVAIWVGVGATAWIASWAVARPGPQPHLLVLPALAGVLAWNFAEFGFGPGSRDLNVLWLIIAAMFVAMGAYVSVTAIRLFWRANPVVSSPDGTSRVAPSVALRASYAGSVPQRRRMKRDLDKDKADRVAALNDLHQRGMITDEQHRDALRESSRS